MNLPNADQARVDREKLTEYLLCPEHPDGAGKAAFFRHFGFNREQWPALAEALRQHGVSNPVRQTVESAYGRRYTVSGPLETPSGRTPLVVSVWIIERGWTAPRLITAYPAGADDD